MEPIAALSHKEFLKIDHDYTKAALAADLEYVNDKDEGIKRSSKSGSFIYTYKNKPLKDEKQLERIKKLAIPPAWTSVWICAAATGHIQATGIDGKSRKQYRYHTQWQALRNETKFHRLYEFGKILPSIRLQVEKDLAAKELNVEKVLATVVSLMERTAIRIGSDDYEKMYGTYGLTTLKDGHVKVKGSTVKFSFKGKKGVHHDIEVHNPKLAKLVKQCQDIPGKELFQYYDNDGVRHSIDSGMVNRYIKEASGGDFTAKDFRTWTGTMEVLQAFCNMESPDSETAFKKNIVAALDIVSKKLGNTRTVCKKYYVHPGIIKLYEEQSLQKYFKELDAIEKNDDLAGLASQENVLMKILKSLV